MPQRSMMKNMCFKVHLCKQPLNVKECEGKFGYQTESHCLQKDLSDHDCSEQGLPICGSGVFLTIRDAQAG